MKRLFSFTLVIGIIVASLSLVACGAATDDEVRAMVQYKTSGVIIGSIQANPSNMTFAVCDPKDGTFSAVVSQNYATEKLKLSEPLVFRTAPQMETDPELNALVLCGPKVATLMKADNTIRGLEAEKAALEKRVEELMKQNQELSKKVYGS